MNLRYARSAALDTFACKSAHSSLCICTCTGAAHLAALAAAAAVPHAEPPAADGNPLVGALPLSRGQAPATASLANILGSIASEFPHQQQQLQQPQQELLLQALLQLQSTAPAAPAPAATDLLALARCALQAPGITAPSIPTAGLQGLADAHSLLVSLLGGGAAGAVPSGERHSFAQGISAGLPAADIAQLLGAHMVPLAAAAAGNSIAGELLAHFTAAAEAQQQKHEQQAAAALHIRQLLGDAAYDTPLAAVIGQAQQQHHPAAAILAAATAGHGQPQPEAGNGHVQAAEASAETHDIDPLKVLQQTLSSLKANLGLEAGAAVPAAAPAEEAAGDGEPEGKQAVSNGQAPADAAGADDKSVPVEAAWQQQPEQQSGAAPFVAPDGATEAGAAGSAPAGEVGPVADDPEVLAVAGGQLPAAADEGQSAEATPMETDS